MNAIRSCPSLVLVAALFATTTALGERRDQSPPTLETNRAEFRKLDIGNKRIYFHQRTHNGAIVEKDFIVYQFDGSTDQFLDKRIHWRPNLPEVALPVVNSRQAVSMVEGEVQFAKLYIISPDSDVFPLNPIPDNPCWVVRSIRDGEIIITIIDAVTGRHLGYGVPPPQSAGFGMSGAQYAEPCGGAWTSWYTHAEYWFEAMGYPTATAEWPTDDVILSHVQSDETAVFYEIGHSHGTHGLLFCSGCTDDYYCEDTTSGEIATWIADYAKMPFTFLASCYGMCDTGPGTLSHAFSKGSTTTTATIGYCDMSEVYCGECWGYSLSWQEELFANMANGDTVAQAYAAAMATHPMCAPTEGWCMRFAGDEDFAIVPVVERGTCAVPDPPGSEAPIACHKNRYISFIPGNPGHQTALRVTLSNLPPAFDAHNGETMWVGEPFEVTEVSGSSGSTPPPTYWAARLCTEAFYADWSSYGTVDVFDNEVVPGAAYEIQAVDENCGAAAESSYSDPLTVPTSEWGDIVGHCEIDPCTPPNGVVDFLDISAVVDKFRNLPGAPTKSRTDLVGSLPDLVIDFVDISSCVDAFRGLPYPFSGPDLAPCP